MLCLYSVNKGRKVCGFICLNAFLNHIWTNEYIFIKLIWGLCHFHAMSWIPRFSQLSQYNYWRQTRPLWIFLFTTSPRPTLGTAWYPKANGGGEGLFPQGQSGCGLKLTSLLHLALMLEFINLCLYSPLHPYGVVFNWAQGQLYYLYVTFSNTGMTIVRTSEM
jgi:hypothetical protein